jgi:CcmD family protein
MRSHIRHLALALLLATTAAPAMAQDAPAAAAESAAPAVEAVSQPAPEVVGSTTHGVPLARPAERTLRPYWHVFIAFALAWALLFGYALSLGRRFGRLERELAGLTPRAE